MKGKVSFYVNVPNLSKVRSRIDKPSKEFTSKVRAAVNTAIVEAVNESTLSLRAKLIKAFSEMGENPKDAKVAAQIASVLSPYFDVIASETPFGADASEEAEEEETAEATDKAPADGKKADDDFED